MSCSSTFRSGGSIVPVEGCSASPIAAIDLDLAKASSISGTNPYSPASMDGPDKPGWVAPKATAVSATVSVRQDLPYPISSAPQTCTWVEFHDGYTNPVPVSVTHSNRLGLSLGDLIRLRQDPTTIERREFDRQVQKTIGSVDELIPQLQQCSTPGADDAHCARQVEYDVATELSDVFGGDYRCANAAPGYSPVAFGAAEDQGLASAEGAECARLWSVVAAAAPSRYRAWHTKVWSTLETAQQDLWRAVGGAAARAYAACDDECGSWQEFSQRVHVDASQDWASLSTTQQEALHLLEFTELTWGRQWALLERIFHGNTQLLTWDELSAREIDAMMAIGYNASGMVNGAPDALPGQSVDWDNGDSDLPACLRMPGQPGSIHMYSWAAMARQCSSAGATTVAAVVSKLNAVRLVPSMWNPAVQQTQKVEGCFWH